MRDGRQVDPSRQGKPGHRQACRADRPGRRRAGREGAGGELLGLFVNFACHLTVMGGQRIHGRLRVLPPRDPAAALPDSRDLPVGFLLGAAGDVTQVDNRRPGREFGAAWAEMFGLAPRGRGDPGRRPDRLAEEADDRRSPDVRPDPDPRSSEVRREMPKLGLGSGSVADEIYARERELVAKERRQAPGDRARCRPSASATSGS